MRIGFSDHDRKEEKIRYPDTLNPSRTTRAQNIFVHLFVEFETWFNPLIEDDSKKSVTVSIKVGRYLPKV